MICEIKKIDYPTFSTGYPTVNWLAECCSGKKKVSKLDRLYTGCIHCSTMGGTPPCINIEACLSIRIYLADFKSSVF